MPSIRIRDLDQRGILTFDLADLLNVLGQSALTSTWMCSVEECISTEDARSDLEQAFSLESRIPGTELTRLAAETRQVIDGVFEAYRHGQPTPWLTLAAIDSTYWEVTASSPDDLMPFRSRFGSVEDI